MGEKQYMMQQMLKGSVHGSLHVVLAIAYVKPK